MSKESENSKKIKALLIKILITPDEFEHYNARPPQDDMELQAYAEKIKIFIEQMIGAEDDKMISGMWIATIEERVERLQVENEKYRVALQYIAAEVKGIEQ